jgi:hypothetical protein
MFAPPNPLDRILRVLIMILPKSLSPKVVPYGGIYEFFPGDTTRPAETTRLFQDPDGRDITMVTGVTVHENKLYLGSLQNDFVGVLDLK